MNGSADQQHFANTANESFMSRRKEHFTTPLLKLINFMSAGFKMFALFTRNRILCNNRIEGDFV